MYIMTLNPGQKFYAAAQVEDLKAPLSSAGVKRSQDIARVEVFFNKFVIFKHCRNILTL